MEREQRDPRPPNRRKNGWMESNVFPTTTGPPSIFRPLHRAFSPLPLFLPLSRVISSFTFLVSASSSHPPSRAPLTAFSNAFQLSSTSISIRYLFYQFTSRCTRVARPGNSCSVARLTTPRRNFEEEREREEEEPCSIAFFFLSRPPLRREQRPWEIFNRPRRLVGEKFLLRAELCTGTVHNVYIRTVGRGGSVRSGKEIFKRGVVVSLHPSTFSPVASCLPSLLLLLLLPLYGWKGESTIVDRLEKHPRRKRNWRILNISRL